MGSFLTSLTRRSFTSGLVSGGAFLGELLIKGASSAMAQGPSRPLRHARGARPPVGLEKRMLELFRNAPSPLAAPKKLDPRFNWVDAGFVTPVRNQGSCGSCWLFAALGAYESAYLIAKNKPDPLLELSEQQILDCSFVETNCVVGGWHEVVFAYLLTEGAIGAYGPTGVPRYLYDSNNPQRGPFCNSNFGERPYYARDWGYVLAGGIVPDETALKQAVVSKGPIVCGVTAGENWDQYKTGIVDAIPSTGNAADVNHEVLIVGWDDNLQGRGFPKNGAWIVKNSWGDNWGERGFIKVPYGGDNIGFGASWISAWP